MSRNLVRALLVGIVVVAMGTVSAFAGTYTFNFNGVGAAADSGGTNSTKSTNITNYMNSVLSGSGVSVTVYGAKEANGYTGDGHVVGSSCSKYISGCTATTLGNDGDGQPGTDRFIITQQTGGQDAIKMVFSQVVYSITFDLEIFPDVSGNPDFTLLTNDGAGGAQQTDLHLSGLTPSGKLSPYSKSHGNVYETSPQLLLNGNNKVTYTSNTGFTTIWFQDWPATIGIDNLTITTGNTPAVPEPASVFLVGSGLLAVVRRKLKKS